MTFDPTVNAGNLITMGLAIIAVIAGWYKFGGRIDMLEYTVETVEKTLQNISDTLKKIAETETKMALIDARQLELERTHATTLAIVEGLRKGEGYITARRANVEGEYLK
jgi:uncharacterized coiled-coil protein SlyX